MAINTVDDLVASTKSPFLIYKTGLWPTLATGNWYSSWFLTPVPGAGAAPSNTTTGVIPTQATAGAVSEFIDPVGGTASYLTGLWGTGTQGGYMVLYDRCWHAGTFTPTNGSYGVTGTTVTRPSGGAGVEIWVEINTALSALNHTLTITYTNQAGVANQSATVTLAASAVAGRMFKATLAASDSGVQQITAMSGNASLPTGNFNVVLMRRLGQLPIMTAVAPSIQNWSELGMPQVYAGSCLFFVYLPGSTTAPVGSIIMGQVANK